MGEQFKAAVSVSEMARMVGLSRARFYQLVGSAFPFPVHDVRTRRPIYVEELQRTCLEIRRRGLGFDGQPIIFNTKRHGPSQQSKPRKPPEQVPPGGRHNPLLNSLRALGLTTIKEEQVEAAMKAVFPNGANGVEQGQIIRALFLHIREQSGDWLKGGLPGLGQNPM
jgi:hypothetical protein